MGNLQSYCCKDSIDVAEDEREEQSRIWSDNVSNQGYGSCLLPRSPVVYNIVLPKLKPVEIDGCQLDDSIDCSHDTQSVSSTLVSPLASPLKSPSSTHPILNVVGGGDQSENDGGLLSSEGESKGENDDKKNCKQHDPKQPAVIKEEYCAEQFDYLRSLILKKPGDQKRFKQLLWSCIPWSAPGGKSGSTFLKTVNDQFILKQMSKLELQSFLSIADEYFDYIKQSYENNIPSLLSIIFGIYRIVYSNSTNSNKYYFMVMRNLFYNRNISQRFDLKGSVRNRLVDTDDPDNTEHVLMDENLLRIACDHPLFIHARSKQILNECIDNDSRFLTSISVMDYSLLVGVDKENNDLVLGIIDYVRPFTWDKKIERVVKSVVSSELPTIIEPELYRERFCEAMDKYFESVPNDF